MEIYLKSINACDHCKRLKRKCIGNPCSQCMKFKRNCTFSPHKRRGRNPKLLDTNKVKGNESKIENSEIRNEKGKEKKRKVTETKENEEKGKEKAKGIKKEETETETETETEIENEEKEFIEEEQNLQVFFNRKENTLSLNFLSSKYCDILTWSFDQFFKKGTTTAANSLGKFAVFTKLDIRALSFLAGVTRSFGDLSISDKYLQFGTKKLNIFLNEIEPTFEKQAELAVSVCSLAAAHSGLDQSRFLHYSAIGKEMVLRLLEGANDEKHCLMLPICFFMIGFHRKPKKLLIMEAIALYKQEQRKQKAKEEQDRYLNLESNFLLESMKEEDTSMEATTMTTAMTATMTTTMTTTMTDQDISSRRAEEQKTAERIMKFEEEMFKSEIYSPSQSQLDRFGSNFQFAFAKIETLLRLKFVRQQLLSYSDHLWNCFYSENLKVEHGVIETRCVPEHVGLYLIEIVDQCERKMQRDAVTIFGSDFNPCFLRFLVYQSMNGDDELSKEESRNCSGCVKILLDCPLIYPGKGLLPTLYILARYMLRVGKTTREREEYEEVVKLMRYWSVGLKHSIKYLEILQSLTHASNPQQQTQHAIRRDVFFPFVR